MKNKAPIINVLDFFTSKGGGSRRGIIALVVVSGLASGFLLAVINAAAEMAANSEVQIRYFVLFGATLLLFTVAKRAALTRATIAAERVIRDVRTRISNNIRHSDLLFVENVGRGDIYARLTQDTSIISQAVPVIFNGYQSAVVLLAGLIYIATVSWLAFLLTLGFLVVGGYAYTRHARKNIIDIMHATAKEAEFFDSLSHLVDGFKEIKINHAKNDGVYERVTSIADETEMLMVRSGLRYVNHLVVAQTIVYLLIATIVFVLPTLDFANPERILKLTASVLFIVGPLELVFIAYHFQNKASAALINIQDLEVRLDAALDHRDAAYVPCGPSPWLDFKTITLENIHFQYPGEGTPFAVGPLNLTIERGTVTFIVGGNGCGKSTLLKLLTGLYSPTSGNILIDVKSIGDAGYPEFREMFSAVFGDFHLFDRLYGLTNIDAQEVNNLLEEMEIGDKTRYIDGAFTDLDLSTGQRKRLAMIVAKLENKPIYVFDEWAADQDPHFRKKFYEEMLPTLKAEGKTILAVTHDDKYFKHSDQLVKLDYGRFTDPD